MKTNVLLLTCLAFIAASCGGDKEEPAPDCSVSDLSISVVSSENDLCGQMIGEMTVGASAGAGEYEFSIDGTTFQAAATFSGLAAGSYTITVRDADGCSKSLTANITDDGSLSFDVASTMSACGTTEGSISVDATDVEGAQFKLNDGAFGNVSVFNNISSGLHIVTVKDDAGCEASEEVLVSSGIGYEAEIAPIISTNCAISGCHNGTQVDFRVFTNVQENADQIKLRTGNKSMPQTGSLTDQEIQAIACWVDDGALDN